MGKQVTELDTLPSFTDMSILPVHNGAGLKKGSLSQLANYLGTKFSNPNLLINPDFRINQRNKTEYDYQTSGATQYTVDRFRAVFLNVKTASDGLILNANGENANGGYFSQVLEYEVKGDTILSFKVSAVVGTIEFKNANSADEGALLSVSSDGTYTVKGNDTKKVIAHLLKGSSCKIEWVKLEQGSIATPFVTPNPAEELMKCKRFFYNVSKTLLAYGIGEKLFIASTEMMNMRKAGTVYILNSESENYIRYEGKMVKIILNVNNFATSTTMGYIRITLENRLADSKVVALDLNSTITIDAEIY